MVCECTERRGHDRAYGFTRYELRSSERIVLCCVSTVVCVLRLYRLSIYGFTRIEVACYFKFEECYTNDEPCVPPLESAVTTKYNIRQITEHDTRDTVVLTVTKQKKGREVSWWRQLELGELHLLSPLLKV